MNLILRPLRAAYLRGVEEGRRQAIQHLRDQAHTHWGGPSDAKRRGALNGAADALRDGRAAGEAA